MVASDLKNYISNNEHVNDEDFAQRFHRIARSCPSAKCLIIDDNLEGPSEYTYAAVYDVACRLQQALRAVPVQPKQLVAIQMKRNADLLISVLACLLNRSPFLLMEPSTPLARRNLLVTDAKPFLLITDQVSLTTETDLPVSLTICSFTHLLSQVPESDVRDLLESHSNDDTMYVMYTSGSTGQPKGVVVPYRAMYNRFRWMWTTYPWIADDIQLWKTSVVFGDCIWEMLGGLLSGVPTVVASATTVRDPCLLLRLIQRTVVTRMTLIPTMLSSLLKLLPTMPQGFLGSLRHVIVSGEALPKIVCKQFLTLSFDAVLLNLYGSTEIGNDATFYEVRHLTDEYDTIPIGKPISNMYYKIVDDELWIAGDGLCSGYLNNVEMTKTKFVHHTDGRRYFKTGDRVRECIRTGQLLFFGRIDSAQVKIRGARVELEEVEAVCMQHPFVHECGCFVHETKVQLIAVVHSSSSDLTTTALQQWISSQLPEFEVPSVFIFTTNPLPRTVSGKIDRKQLILRYENWRLDTSSISMAEDTHDHKVQRTMALWCRTLGILEDDETSTRLTFTELGGHSLLAIQLQYEFRYEFGIQVPIEQFFCQTTVLDMIKFIQTSTSISPSSEIGESGCQTAPLTLAQKSIWIADELQSLSITPVYNVACAFEILDKNITTGRIKEALNILLKRHESLRMIFSRKTSGEIYQTVTMLKDDLTVADVRIFQEISIENVNDTDRILAQLANVKFHLTESQPLCRFYLCINTHQRILTIVFHHLIIDGWSIGILVRDLESILMSQTLRPIVMQFPEYAQLEYKLDPHAYDADLIYWKNKLNNGVLTTTRLLHDHELLPINGPSVVGRVQLEFPSDITDLIRNMSKTNDVTPFMILLTTFKALLARYTQETDIIVGTPVANRTQSEIEHTIGLFTNTLALRTDLTNSSTFFDLLSRVKTTVLDAFAHQSLPFVRLLSELEYLQRDQHALFQIMFAYQNVGNEPMNMLRKIKIDEQAAKFELDIQIWTESTSMLVEAYFRRDIFDVSSIERFLYHWLQLTRSALANPMNPYTHWSITTNDDSLSIVQVKQSNVHSNSKNLCQLFLEQVERARDAIAVKDGYIHLTYIQVWQKSIQFSHVIRQVLTSTSTSKQCIAIRMRRGADLILTIWSILLSGNHYVYIDTTLPVERQNFILHDTRASLMITDSLEGTESIPAIRFEIPEMPSVTTTLELVNDPTDLAYILYTSGSTGSPKGVCASHGAIVARMVNVNYHSIRPQTRVGQLSTFSFDMSTFEMFGTLLNGGILVIIAPEAACSARALLELQLDIISPSTAVLNVLAQQEAARPLFASLRNIYFGGEKVNMKYLRRAIEHQALGKFIHVYGPTETTVFALFYDLSVPIPAEALTIPIGRPLSNTFVYIVDPSFQLTPRGIPGELLIGGAGLSAGYHNRTDLTQQKFISNPFGKGLVYCTGDICRMRDDGNIEFLRRLDTQVKLRSQRLELGEIEFHLLQHEHIENAIVLLREDIVEEEQHLVGYIQPSHSSTITLDLAQVRTFLIAHLPKYMVPAYIVIMPQFPLNHVGKIDKKSLPKPQQQTLSSLNVSEVIRRICAQVLKRNYIDINASFFQLGGHSLSAMEIIAKLYENLNVQITIPTLFQAKSIAEFIHDVEMQATKTEDRQTEMSNVRSGSHRAPLTSTQQQFWLFWKLKPNSCYYNIPITLEINGQLNVVTLTRCFHRLMSKYVLLRMKFVEEANGTLWQEENNDWNLPIIEEFLEGTVQTPHVLERLKYYSMKTFELNKGYVCRFIILHLSNNRHILLVCFHHIICDGQSASRFMSELFDLYELGHSNLPLELDNEKSFIDYAIHVSKLSPVNYHLDEMINYLRNFQSLVFDTDLGVEQKQDIGSMSHILSFQVPSEIAEKLRELAITHACTLHTVLLTLFKCVLSVYCFNTSDIVLGSIISTRSQPGVNNLFGPLINTVPIRTRLPDEPNTTFIDLLESVRISVLFGMEHHMIPFADIVQRLRLISTDSSLFTYLPVIRVLFEMNSYNLFNRTNRFADGTEWINLNTSTFLSSYSKSDIDFEIMDYGINQPFQVTCHVNCNLFKSDIAKTIVNCYRYAIDTIARHPMCSRLQLWQQLHLIRKNNSDLILHECFRQQVEIRGKHPAVIYQDQIWTYEELLQQAEKIATYLCDIHVKSGDVIGLYMKRCTHLIAAMFGVMMTGAIYLYLDPELPDQTIRNMLQDATVKIVIEREKECSIIECMHLNLNEIFATETKHHSLFPIVKSSDYCYLIYTSGSTGKPKGIQIQHQAVARRIHMPIAIISSSTVAQLTSCSFDVYILEVYGALLNGATLIIYDKTLIFQPKLLSQQIIRQHITHMYLPTPIFNLLAEYVPDVFANMECVLFAGDRANAKLMRTVLQTSEPPKRLINAYGPTESTCIVTCYDTSIQTDVLSDDSQVPIGVALPDTSLYIANPTTLELVANGEEGELLIGGYGVSDGYINNIDQTEAKFIFNQYDGKGKVYRTGDRVRRCQNGNLQFLGRLDTQVKVNGYRIELSEIEYVLQGYSTITEAIVIVRDDLVPNTQSIVAYVRPSKQIEIDIRRYLNDQLPSYMLPSFIVPIDQIPISFMGGKRDVNNLPRPTNYAAKNDHISGTEAKVQLAWNNVLNHGVNRRVFHADDDFFACGGTSINVVQLHAQLESQFGLTLDVMRLFLHRTVRIQVTWLASLQPTVEIPTVSSKPNIPTRGVAIIGMSARYGPVETTTDLWTALRNGTDCCTHMTHEEVLRQDSSMAQMLARNPNYVHASSTMTNAYCFDHLFFGMTKRDAAITDPQHRIMLEATYEALENAGLVPQTYTGTIGMFGAIYRNTYADCYNLLRANPYEIYDATKANMGITNFDPATVMRVEIGNMIDGAPTFISYKLGLNGPSMAIQTACSSSGTALHMALRSLEAGDCTVAVVAGVCITFPLGIGYNYQPGMIMSKTGYCRAFDESADGVVGGDGAGVVVLMKAMEAAADGYAIRGIITGYAINNDGHNKATYSTTSPDMQASCMRQALAMAKIQHPLKEIDYVEAHGPGTQMGDLLEIQALTKAYTDDDELTKRQIYLGSIKTNVGHTAHAATLAGLIKIVLSLEADEIPPTLNFHRYSPTVSRLRPPFNVNAQIVSWHSVTGNRRPRRAALNALGQGGTNTHFIVEQGYATSEPNVSSEHHVFLFSGKTDDALSKVKQRLLDYLSNAKEHQLSNIAFTLACGRIRYEKRDFIVAASIEELKQRLLSPTVSNNTDGSIKSRVVFVFPGQGSQYAGMARRLYDRFPHTCGSVIDTCLQHVHDQDVDMHQTIRACLFDETFDDQIAAAQYAQVTLFIIEYSLATLFISLNIRPDYLIGHSSGEFVAACVAEVMTVKDAVRLLVQRCQLMVTASSGAMLAVEMTSNDDALAVSTKYDVDLAVINSPSQHVYSGTTTNIRRLEAELRTRGNKVKILSTLTGFHSRLMDPICQKLEANVKTIALQEPTIPIISTVTARFVNVGEMTRTKYWCDHLRQPVLFGPCLTRMLTDNLIANDESTIFISVGPGKALHSLCSRAVPKAIVINSPLLHNQLSALQYTLGSIWTKKIPINWSEYFQGTRSRRVPLPTYPFVRTVCVADDRATSTTNNSLCNFSDEPKASSYRNCSDSCSPTDLFEMLDQKHAVCEPTKLQSVGKKAPPWKITKHADVAVKLLDLRTGTSTSIQVTSAIQDDMQLYLGSCSSLFVQALYYEALEMRLIKTNDSLMKFLPIEYRLPNLAFTIEDLMQSNINTNAQCSTPNDLLTALQQVRLQVSNEVNHVPSVFALSLLGHILATLHETSYDDIVYHRIILSLGLKQTCVDISISNEAYYPAMGIRSSIADLQTSLISPVDMPITKAFRKALAHGHLQFTGVEQLITTIHPNDPNKSLIIASEQPLQRAFYETIIEQLHISSNVQSREPSINYEDIVQAYLVQLLGSSGDTMVSNFSSLTPFEQLGVDSLQAITFVELLSQKFNIELPVDIIFQYPNIKNLADKLKQLCSNNHNPEDTLQEYILNEEAGMPRVYEATKNNNSLSTLVSFITHHKSTLLKSLHQYGALLFRSFDVNTAEEFSQVVELLADKGKTFLDYRDGISPRTRLNDKVFTSTDYPKQFDMPLHNEMSYSHTMPSMIFFFCQVPPDPSAGGETPIGNSSAIYNAIDPNIRDEFIRKKLLYITNLPSKTNGISLGKSWQDTYQTQSKMEVETFLKDKQIQFKWLPNDNLRTLRRGDAIRQHPITSVTTWCNHAHLFHPTDLNESTRQALQKRMDPMDMPKNCFFGNGDIIPDASLNHVRQVLKQHEIKFSWHKGDILVLDNFRTAHGRALFNGQRRILVAMC